MTPYGYIYKTTIQTSKGEIIYFGQHKKSHFDKNYYGSGRKIGDWFKKHKNDFKDKIKVELLEWAYSLNEINNLEAKYVEPHLDKEYCWNLRNGGNQVGFTEEHRKNISEANKGKIRTDEMKEKQRQAMLGKPGPRKGVIISEETKRKMSISAKNKPPMSEETKQKLSDSLSKVVHTEEWNKKVSDAIKVLPKERRSMYGKKHSEETIKKMSNIKKGLNNPMALNKQLYLDLINLYKSTTWKSINQFHKEFIKFHKVSYHGVRGILYREGLITK